VIVAAGAEGAVPEPLTPPHFDASRPTWSWHPETIAFVKDNGAIYTIGADGTGLAPYLPEPLDGLKLFHPCWYQDLRSLAAVGLREGPAGRERRLYRLTPGAPAPLQPLTRFPEVCAGRPGVSPDGATVAFSGNAGGCDQARNQVWLVTPPQPARRLEPGEPATAHQGRSPSWSPDGRWIAFVSTRPAPLPGEDTPKALWIAAASGEQAWQITDTAFNPGQVEWSRDQARIVLGSFTHGIGVLEVPAPFRPDRPLA
jgi:hypothetical protein